jgi:hypothetical protein
MMPELRTLRGMVVGQLFQFLGHNLLEDYDAGRQLVSFEDTLGWAGHPRR